MPRPPSGATGLSQQTGRISFTRQKISGTRVFVATEITDIGYVRNRFDHDPEAEPIRSLVIRGYIDEDGEGVRISTDERISFGSQANLIKWLTACRSGEEPGTDESVDPGEIVGRPVMVTVRSRPSQKGDGYYLDMRQPSSLPPGMPVPDSLLRLVRDPGAPFDPFVWRTEQQLESIRNRITGRAAGHGHPEEAPEDEHPNARPAQPRTSHDTQPQAAHAASPDEPPPVSPEQDDGPHGAARRAHAQGQALPGVDAEWKAAHARYSRAAKAALARFGFKDGPGAGAARERAVAAFWGVFAEYPLIARGRRAPDSQAFEVVPTRYPDPQLLDHAADILNRYAHQGRAGLTEADLLDPSMLATDADLESLIGDAKPF